MFSFFTYCIYTSLVSVFVYLDGPNIVKHNVVEKYHNFRKINRLVSTNYKGMFNILCISLSLVVKALWISILQNINNTIVKIDKNKYRITYIIEGKVYKMILKTNRGPKKVLLIYDENQEDVSDLILPYLGPQENWHGDVYTPKFFTKNELTFELSCGDQRVFSGDDIMLL